MDGQLDDADEVRAQAAEWFARLKSVPVSRDTLEQFFEWRRVPAHAAAFEAVERVWSITGGAADRPAIAAAVDDVERRGKRGAGKPRWRGPLVIAATAVLGGAGLSVLLIDQGQAYETQIGEQRAIVLDDGSKLTLDTDTKVIVRYDKAERRVTLDHGQAYFVVAHAARRPFLVDAKDAEVLATGTQFQVRRTGPATEVTLVEGSVEVTSSRSRAITKLASGQQYRVTDAQGPAVRQINATADTAWRGGRIVLDEMPLVAAVAEVNRYVHKPIQVSAGDVAAERVSGSFETGDVDGFLAAATAILPLRVERTTDGSVRLVQRAGPAQK